MKVNELARQARVPAHVVRYYARIGLLKPRHNPENHYREFSGADLQRLHFIRRAQSLGYALHEIATLLQRLETGQASWSWLREMLEARYRNTLHALDHLQTQVGHLDQLLSKTATLGKSCTLPEALTWMGAGLLEGKGVPSPAPGLQRPHESRTARRMAHEQSSGKGPAYPSL